MKNFCYIFVTTLSVISFNGNCDSDMNYMNKENLVGYYPLNENIGNTAHDKSSQGCNGKIFFAKRISEHGNTVIEFSEPCSWIKLPNENLNFKEDFTIQAWICPDKFIGKRFIVSNGAYWLYQGYLFYLDEDNLCFDLNTEKGRFSVRANLHKYVNDKTNWMNVAVSYNVKEKKLSLFTDGKISNEVPAHGQIKPYASYDKNPCIGAIARGEDYERNEYNWQFRGFIRDVLFYNMALSPEQILGNYDKSQNEYKNINICHKGKRDAVFLNSQLSVQIENENNEKTPARVYLKNTQTGKYCGTERLFYYQSGEMTIPAFSYAVDGLFCIQVPSGKYEMTIIHGPEYLPEKQNFVLKDNEKKDISIQLKRFINMAALNWYSGDHHVHCGTHGNISRDSFPSWNEVCEIFQAEGLSFACVREDSRKSWPDMAGNEELSFSSKNFICKAGPAERKHCCYITNKNTLDKNYDFMYLNAEHLDGVACSHYYFDEIVLEAPFSRGRYIFDFFSHSGHPGEVYDLWTKINNIGLKLPACTGSDFDANVFASQCRPPPGGKRVYLRLPELSWENIIEAYKNGAIFATSGPLLLIKANKKEIGQELALPDGENIVDIDIEAYAWWGLKKVEIIQNGSIVSTFNIDKQTVFKKSLRLEIKNSSWIAARCFSTPSEYFGDCAITSPIYIKTDKPISIKKDDIDFLLKKLDAVKNKPQYQTPANKDLIRKTEDFYRKLLEQLQ